MATINKISVNGTEYDIRSTIPTLNMNNGYTNLDSIIPHEITKGIYEFGIYYKDLAFNSESQTLALTNRGGDSYKIIGVEGYIINSNNVLINIFHGTTSVFDNSDFVKIGYNSGDNQTITFSNKSMANIVSLSYYFKFTLLKKL